MAEYTKTVAFCGNPNVGKSTIFNSLTGMHQHTGNWPGKTVGSARGKMEAGNGKTVTLVDLPGTYSLLAHSPEEEVTRDFLLRGGADAVVIVCDATCLSRNLNLALQVLRVTRRVVVCVNLIDEAEKKGICIDSEALSGLLGVPVIGTNARRKKSVQRLKAEILRCTERTETDLLPYPVSEEDVSALVSEAERIATLCVIRKERSVHDDPDRRIDRIVTGKRFGYPVMLLLLTLVLWLTIAGANYPSAWLSAFFAWCQRKILVGLTALSVPSGICSALTDGCFGTLFRVVSVMLPPMAIFFPLFTLLEDLGYLPRVAFNLDRPFKKCGACGKQALTMCMGLGCNAAAIVGCRIVDSRRERLLSLLTNNFMPCNGRFPLLITLIPLCVGGIPFIGTSVTEALLLTLAICFGVLATFFTSAVLSRTLLRGTPSAFTLELPPYRRPQIVKTLVRSLMDRTLFVLGRAAAVAAPAGLLLWIFANVTVSGTPILRILADFLNPVGTFFGMDGAILLAFLLALPANEIVLPIILMIYTTGSALPAEFSAEATRTLLLANGWNRGTAICVCLFCLFHFPCSTTLLTIRKESGSWKWTLLSALIPTAEGLLLCLLVRLLG